MRCGAVETKEIPAAGHTWKEESADDKVLMKCTVCNETYELILQENNGIGIELDGKILDKFADFEKIVVKAEKAETENLSEVKKAVIETLSQNTYVVELTATGFNSADAVTGETISDLGGIATITLQRMEQRKKCLRFLI